MGFCKPGDNCFNQKVLNLNSVYNKYLPVNIVQQINQAITGASIDVGEMEDCGVVVPNFCPDVLTCLSGHTGHGTGYWVMNGSGDIYNTGTTSSYVGIGFDTPTNQLHVKASVTDDPIRVQGLNSQENYIVTVDTDGIFYQSENTSDRIDGGEF
jgi:hypothetical protein|tara:strand:- start:3855 stop:4316 length:462 start_codon:yes stop_codon:yes gene_type:complete